MAENLLSLAEVDPDRPAIIDEFTELTRAEFNSRVNQLVHGLRGAGLGPGDTVALLSDNRHEYMETVAATGCSSWVLVPLNWHFTAGELAYILEDSGTKVLLADAAFSDLAVAAAAESPGVEIKIMFGGPAAPGARGVPEDAGFADYEELLAASPTTEPEDQATGAYLLYTSGTTGRPKGVSSTAFATGQPLMVRNIMLQGLAGLFQMPEGGAVLVNSPLYHGGPFLYTHLAAALGATVVARRRFDAAETLRLIDEHKITTAYFVPTHFVRFLKLDEATRKTFDGSSLKAVYHTAAPCAPEVKRQMLEWWGPVIHELYAATETGALGTFVTGAEWLNKPGTVGRAMPVAEILIIGADGQRLGPGQEGQIYIKNLVGGDFEYKGAPEKTAEAHLEPGVMTVGDVGYLDEDGYLFLCDRKIDMVISGGVNIYPAEIEAVLVTHPAVADAAVFGVPNDEFGEEVKAVVELAPGHEASDELAVDLLNFARQHLARYKVPRSVEFSAGLPRTPTGKLLKRELRDPYWAGRERVI
ncbi:MAG: AMP-binding protein [Acidimicrobiia bacterium]